MLELMCMEFTSTRPSVTWLSLTHSCTLEVMFTKPRRAGRVKTSSWRYVFMGEFFDGINRITESDFDRRNVKDMKNKTVTEEGFPSFLSCDSCLSCLKIGLSSNPVNLVNPVQ